MIFVEIAAVPQVKADSLPYCFQEHPSASPEVQLGLNAVNHHNIHCVKALLSIKCWTCFYLARYGNQKAPSLGQLIYGLSGNSWFGPLNQKLRHQVDLDSWEQDYVASLCYAISNEYDTVLPTSTLYRSVQLDADDLGNYKEGNFIWWHEFTLTSATLCKTFDKSAGANTLFVISTFPGFRSSISRVGAHSEYDKDEVVMNCNSAFLVRKRSAF